MFEKSISIQVVILKTGDFLDNAEKNTDGRKTRENQTEFVKTGKSKNFWRICVNLI